MDAFFEILKYTIPALIVFAVVYLMLRKYMQVEYSRRKYLLYKESQKTTLPIRLTAYERIVLFLERISPDSLLVRIQDGSMNSLQFHSALLTAIRSEYEHNVAQQVYISEEAWNVVKNAKENIVQLINACAAQVSPQDSSYDLAKLILSTYEQNSDSPTMAAIAFLKNEIKNYFA
ncbi:MAG: hypothetical protein EOL95_03150 [Bacteroidia bacterium]|nr:hypothetical protein [Bacteroidia bacterium]